ncbi:TolC family protein [Bacteroidota bacterium]
MKWQNALTMLLILLSISYGQSADKTIDQIINRALNVSPKIKMLYAKKSAVSNRITQQSNLPDPILTLGLTNLPTNSFSFTQEPMTGKVVGLSQAFPFPGKLGAMEKVLNKDIGIIQKEIDDAKNEIAKQVKQSYYELLLVRYELKIADENKKLLTEIAKVVQAKYSVSSASQQNVIKVELEITNLNNKIILLTKREAEQIAKLNSLLFDDATKYITINVLPEIELVEFSVNQLDTIAKLNRPYLLGLQLAESKAVEQQNLAEYDFYPNFNLMLQYSMRDKIAKTNTPLNDFFSVVAGISLPLNYGGKVTAKVEEAVSMKEFYSSQYDAAVQLLNANFGTIIAELISLHQRYLLITEGKIQQAEQNYSSALSGYQVGNVDFLNVTDALKILFDVETELYSIKAKYAQTLAQLEFLTGSELTNKK